MCLAVADSMADTGDDVCIYMCGSTYNRTSYVASPAFLWGGRLAGEVTMDQANTCMSFNSAHTADRSQIWYRLCEYCRMPGRSGGFVVCCLLVLRACSLLHGQNVGTFRPSAPTGQVGFPDVSADEAWAKAELKTGTDLTRRGLLEDAIPHLQAAQRAGSDVYAAAVNLAICYVGLRRYKSAIPTLEGLHSSGYKSATVDNLLTQAYIGDGQRGRAMATFKEAVALTPKDESLFAFIADSCTDHSDFEMGLLVVETGLQTLPDSARLHYEKALFLAQLDRLDEARPEFDRAALLAPDSYIATLALVQKDIYADNFAEATRLLRAAVSAGHRDYRTLSVLGTVLMSAGAAPGDPEWGEAKSALEEAIKQDPEDSPAQIALGKVCVMEGRFSEAVDHLEIGRRLEPDNSAVYVNLAHAYRRLGDREKASLMEAQLARILAEKKRLPVPSAR